MRRLKIFTWHVHGSYLYYLARLPHDIYLPINAARSEGYNGLTASYPWPPNLHEIPVENLSEFRFDCILFQSKKPYVEDQYEILSDQQRHLPKIYLEHDPPREHPTDTPHFVDDSNTMLVHVTHFNRLMWDSGNIPCRVIEHGVIDSDNIHYTGEIGRGITVVNNMRSRGRRLGLDIFQAMRRTLPLDLVGMDAKSLGGLGEISHQVLSRFQSRYRFFFNPIRYTSLGLAVVEAMMVGLPIVGLATTELSTVIRDGESGYLSTDPNSLIEKMLRLLEEPRHALELGLAARRTALERFNIHRFIKDWNSALREVTSS